MLEVLAASHRGSIIVVGGDHNHRPSRVQLSTHDRATDGICSRQMEAHIKKILSRTGAGIQTVGKAQFDWDGTEKLRMLFFKPVSVRDAVLNRLDEYGLTRREEEIALCVMRGLSNREIAEKLFICEQTVKDHLRDTFQRMRIHRRSELSAKLLLPALDGPIPSPPPPKRLPR